jgi:hypothetical protein
MQPGAMVGLDLKEVLYGRTGFEGGVIRGCGCEGGCSEGCVAVEVHVKGGAEAVILDGGELGVMVSVSLFCIVILPPPQVQPQSLC